MNDASGSIQQTTVDQRLFQGGCGCSYCQNGSDHAGYNAESFVPEKDYAVLPGGGGTVTPEAIGVNNAAELIHGYEWGPGGGTAASVSFSFLSAVPSYYASDAQERNDFTPFTTDMQNAIRTALTEISNYANITFTETAGVGDITFGQADLTTSDSDPVAWAYYPDQGGYSGDVWFNTNFNFTGVMDKGDIGYYAAIHEIGHSLGLVHSFTAGLTGNENTEQFTVMAYDTGPWGNVFAQTHMLYDVSAIQAIYGANTSFNSGDTVYTLDPNAAYTVWDGGGTDTFDASAISTGVTIHLEEGGYSSIGLSEHIAIAYGAVIENAIGGSGNDFIYGNDADNVLTGGMGDDILIGGGGNDEAVFSDYYFNYQINEDAGSITVVHLPLLNNEGTDLLEGIERLSFLDGYYEGGVFTDTSNTDPVAQDDIFTVYKGTVFNGNLLADNGNGVDFDTDGGILSVVAQTISTGHAVVQIFENGVFTYAADQDYVGIDNFSYTLLDGQGGSDVGNVTVNLWEDGEPTVDFTGASFISYNGSQDAGGSIGVIEAGAGVEISGNAWKRMAFDYTITEDTVISFEYRSTVQGEVQGFSLDNDNSQFTGTSYQLYGIETPYTFTRDFQYADIGNWQSFTIDVGAYQAGDVVNWFGFVNDHDGGSKNGTSFYRNISIYEDTTPDTDPVAADDIFSGDQDIAIMGNLLADNGNGVDSDPQGDTLNVVAGTFTTLHGDVTIASSGDFTYTPDSGYVGTDSFTYILEDGNGGSDTGNVSIQLNSTNPVDPDVLDFTGASFISYNGSQDAGGSIGVIEAGAGVEISGNAWKRTAFDYTITEDTVISFEYRSTVQGEVQGFSLDNDNSQFTGTSYQLYGIETPYTFTRDFQYTDIGNWQSFTIDVGSYQAGDVVNWFGFVNDHDGGSKNGTSFYRNISIYEDTTPSTDDVVPDIAPLTFDIADFSSFSNQDTNPTGTLVNGTRVELNGNNWKSVDFDYEVTQHSVMTFDFQSSNRGEIHALGFDNDNNHETDKAIQLYGTQNWGQNGPNYTGGGASQSFEIDLSDFYSVGASFTHLTFVSDDDKSSASNSVFDNIRIYELGTQSADTMNGTAQSQSFVGLEGGDTIMAGGGDDALYGGSGMDELYGEGGADTFMFEAISAFTAIDNVRDFSLADGDMLDISDILEGFYTNPIAQAITDFVQITDNGTNSFLAVDADGGADNFVQIATLYGQTGLTDEDGLETAGTLITV